MSKIPGDKPVRFLTDEVRTPPLSRRVRRAAGVLLRRLQRGESIGMPESRPMPSVGPRCHELRLSDGPVDWRVFYRLDQDAIVVAAVHEKRTRRMPGRFIDLCRRRLRDYDAP